MPVTENNKICIFFRSFQVFNNFPPWGFNLKRANCLDFSLNGGYMAIGNNFGAANLYRLKHFGNF